MDKFVLIDDNGEMLLCGFSKEERILALENIDEFKAWIYINGKE